MISHEGKFIFIWIPKNGGSSVNQALLSYLPKYSKKFRTDRAKEFQPVRHKSAKDLKEQKEFTTYWEDYFKFAFVRNPWDHMISWYNNAGRSKKGSSFRDWIKKEHYKGHKFYTNHSILLNDVLCGQINHLVDKDGNFIVDYIGKMENMKKDFKNICSQLNIEDIDLPKIHITPKKKNRKDFYNNDKDLIKKVEELYKDDIKYFGYKFSD